jgi:hypothetical protein
MRMLPIELRAEVNKENLDNLVDDESCFIKEIRFKDETHLRCLQ